jgi:hypothetical protein
MSETDYVDFYELVKRVNVTNGNNSIPFIFYEEWMLPQINKYYNVDLTEDDQVEKGIRFVKRK